MPPPGRHLDQFEPRLTLDVDGSVQHALLLEAMEERQVTVEGETRPLPDPFFVIATQNPSHQIGTFPLPESQLDRFLMRIELGYPDRSAERALLVSGGQRVQADQLMPLIEAGDLPSMQREAAAVHAAEPLIDYVQALVEATRRDPAFQHGLSPRAGLALHLGQPEVEHVLVTAGTGVPTSGLILG